MQLEKELLQKVLGITYPIVKMRLTTSKEQLTYWYEYPDKSLQIKNIDLYRLANLYKSFFFTQKFTITSGKTLHNGWFASFEGHTIVQNQDSEYDAIFLLSEIIYENLLKIK